MRTSNLLSRFQYYLHGFVHFNIAKNGVTSLSRRLLSVKQIAAEYRQIAKYCERCRAATPHQVRENDGVVAKICVVCLLRGYLSGRPLAEEANWDR